ncbi:MAG: winged helix DNA-binding protein [Hespellia sp.]|nr:winged helix DNA-binding protein [Hespellia sp.]
MQANEFVASGYQIRKLIEKKSEPLMEKYHLRIVELDILVILFRSKRIDTAKAIIQKKHISKAHASKSVENLQNEGYVLLTEDESDHRIVHISLTEKANQVVEDAMEIYEECRQIMFRGITEDQRVVMKQVMKQVSDNLRQELGNE